MTAVIVDTETTDADEPQVIQLGCMGPLDTVQSVGETRLLSFKPTKPISLGALATHHIIADDLEQCPEWSLEAFSLPANTDYIVGHNVDFDWRAIGSPNVKRICTLALARRAWPDLDSYKLAALIYSLYPHAIARTLVKDAHNAAADVDLCQRVLVALWTAFGQPASWDALWTISEEARVPTHFTFGKYGPRDGQKGALIAHVRRSDPGYIRWCLSSCDIVTGDPYWQKALKA